MAGRLIVIEGGDGSGKTKQTNLLVSCLQQDGYQLETLDFPQYQNFGGKLIRAYLDGQFSDPTEIDPYLASILYAIDRYESREIIWDWLKAGKIVILNRYLTANIIHQGAKIMGQPNFQEKSLEKFVRFIETLEFDTLGIPCPNLVIYLHVLTEISRKLMTKQGRKKDGHETNLDFNQRVEKVALWACRNLSWEKIECCPNGPILPVEKIHDLVFSLVKGWLTEMEKIEKEMEEEYKSASMIVQQLPPTKKRRKKNHA